MGTGQANQPGGRGRRWEQDEKGGTEQEKVNSGLHSVYTI